MTYKRVQHFIRLCLQPFISMNLQLAMSNCCQTKKTIYYLSENMTRPHIADGQHQHVSGLEQLLTEPTFSLCRRNKSEISIGWRELHTLRYLSTTQRIQTIYTCIIFSSTIPGSVSIAITDYRSASDLPRRKPVDVVSYLFIYLFNY